MKKTLIIVGILLTILLMILINDWQTKDWQQEALEKVTGLNNEESTSLTYFEAPGFKISYPANWIPLQTSLSQLVPIDWKEKYGLKILLFSQNFNPFIQLIVYEGEFNIPLEEVIEKMGKDNQEYGWEVKTIKSEIKNDEGIFELEYSIPGSQSLYTKEKAIKLGEKTYLISTVILEKDLTALSQQIDLILNSIDRSE